MHNVAVGDRAFSMIIISEGIGVGKHSLFINL